MTVRVQHEDFDTGAEITRMRLSRPDIGAVVAFVGQVRDMNEGSQIATMTLEHYPGMTEKSLQAIMDEAHARWDVMEALVIHRIGALKPTDQIVLVLVAKIGRAHV